MFKLMHALPEKCLVACSGGIDSMCALHWLSKHNNGRVVGVVHINHNTGLFANQAEALVGQYCTVHGLTLQVFRVEGSPPKGESKECWWRDKRYEFFAQATPDADIVLAHQFSDCVEEYLINVLVRGYISTIAYRNGRCIRPFRLWKKEDIKQYAAKNNVPYIDDPSNNDTKYLRNRIRHELIPGVHKVNAGFDNIVKRLIRGENK